MATTSEDISTLACEDEAHLVAFTEQDEEFYGFALELPRNPYHHGRGFDVDIGSED